MRNTMTIARRQLLSYFNGPVAYVVGCVLLVALGIFFWQPFFLKQRCTIRDMFQILAYVLYITMPALTMGLVAEEKRSGSIELLITMPVKDWEVVVGKFLAAFGLIAIIILLTAPYPFSVASLGRLDWGTVFSGYLGILLVAGALTAFGLMASTFTKDQITAFFVALVLGLALFVIDFFMQFLSNYASVVEWLSFGYHLGNMSRGVIDSRDVVYFVSIMILCLGVSFSSLDSRRWR